jgi:CHASE3 domain sensor protein
MHRVIISFLVAFVLLMVVIILSRTSFNNTQQFERQAENSRNVIRLFNKIDAQFRSGIIYTPSYESSAAWDLYALYKKELNEIPASFAPLKPFLNEKPDNVP